MSHPRQKKLDHARLTFLLAYDGRTGIFTWKVKRGRTAMPGMEAGTPGIDGIKSIMVDGRLYRANRLAWLYTYGEMPKGRMTFKDQNPLNNRIDNLMLESERQSFSRAAIYQRQRRAALRAERDRQ